MITLLRADRQPGSGVKVIELPHNVGKTKAVLRGVGEARHPVMLLCDADLVNLNEKHVAEMVRVYCESWDMVIMDKGSQPWVFRRLLRSVPAASGTRILDKRHLLDVPFRETDRFRFENRINNHFLQNNLTIAISPAPEIHDRRKFVKYPFWLGLLMDLHSGWDVMVSDGVTNVLSTFMTFRKISGLVKWR
jgi:hypothetical protein